MIFKTFTKITMGSALVLGSLAANAAFITLGSDSYEVSTVTGLHSDFTAQIESTPWWGSQTYASSAVLQILDTLGPQPCDVCV